MKLYDKLVSNNQKAIVAFLVPAIVGLGAYVGIDGEMTVNEAVGVVVTAVLTSAGVWFKRNQ